MKTKYRMDKNEIEVPISNELMDLKREREIFAQESIEGKNVFAENVKDVLGEQIRKELKKKAKHTPKEAKKKNKIQNFLDKLTNICQ